jgi:hypothetical protein
VQAVLGLVVELRTDLCQPVVEGRQAVHEPDRGVDALLLVLPKSPWRVNRRGGPKVLAVRAKGSDRDQAGSGPGHSAPGVVFPAGRGPLALIVRPRTVWNED